MCVSFVVAKEKSITETARIRAKMRITKFQHNENILCSLPRCTLLVSLFFHPTQEALHMLNEVCIFFSSVLFSLSTNLRILYIVVVVVVVINAARYEHITSFVDSFDLFFPFVFLSVSASSSSLFSCVDTFCQRGYADMPS